nr:PH domain-containing protein [uncultured Methanoregula sp.]
MRQNPEFPLNTPFRPAAALKTTLTVYILLFILLMLCFTLFPLLLAGEWAPNLVLLCVILLVIIIAVCLAWVHLYYKSMWYELREDEMSWKRGVWFRTTGIVPYNRITNLDIRQGPLMRLLGIHTIAIQTAGYSGQTTSEIKIEGVEKAEELREFIRSLVRHTAGTGDGTGTVDRVNITTDEKILSELTRIRILLEEQKK